MGDGVPVRQIPVSANQWQPRWKRSRGRLERGRRARLALARGGEIVRRRFGLLHGIRTDRDIGTGARADAFDHDDEDEQHCGCPHDLEQQVFELHGEVLPPAASLFLGRSPRASETADGSRVVDVVRPLR
jgi:hypothetical protein